MRRASAGGAIEKDAADELRVTSAPWAKCTGAGTRNSGCPVDRLIAPHGASTTKLTRPTQDSQRSWSPSTAAMVAARHRREGSMNTFFPRENNTTRPLPLALNANVVMHSATKYLNGHSEVIAGVLVFARNDAYSGRAARVRATLGSILGPFRGGLAVAGPAHLACPCAPPIRVRHEHRPLLGAP